MNFNTIKSACKLVTTQAAASTTKSLKTGLNLNVKPQPRLFSVKSDPVIGTEITNNITGTRFFAAPSLDRKNVYVGELAKRLNPDGSYSSIPRGKFDALLTGIRKDKEHWNPIIQSDATIGKEVVINRYGYNRYFRPADGPTKDLITCIEQNGHHNSKTLSEFDDMILSYLG